FDLEDFDLPDFAVDYLPMNIAFTLLEPAGHLCHLGLVFVGQRFQQAALREVFQPVQLLLGVFCQSIVIGQPTQLSVISSNDLVVTEVKQFGTLYGLQAVIVPIASGLAELLDPLLGDIEVYLLIDRPLLRMSSANRDFHFFLVRVASDFVSLSLPAFTD